MEILRTIGNFEILVDSAEPESISLPEDLVVERGDGLESATLSRRQILRLLSNGDDYRPLSLTWELLDKCNFACPFCYIVGHSRDRVVRFPEIASHLEELVAEGVLFCTLTGGEVTVHPDFLEIYTFLKERGVIVRVFTNGSRISEETLKLWRKLPPSEIQVSVYTLEDTKLRGIYGAKGTHPACSVLENILKLRDSGLNVTCKTFLNKLTEEDVGSVAEWCRQNSIEYFASSELTRAYDGADLTEFAVVEGRAYDLSRPAQCFPCGTVNYGCAISSAFEFYPCPAIQLKDCRFDLRRIGVRNSIAKMKAFMRKFQDSPIHRVCGTGKCATCIATAKPIRDGAGEILYFSDP